VIAHIDDQATAKRIRSMNLPTIVKGMPLTGIPCISADDQAIGHIVAEHFLSRGFKNFAFCGLERDWSPKRGLQFEKRIAEAGFSVNHFPVRKQKGWDKQLQAMTIWLDGLTKPTALMACNDDRARHVIEACKHANISVPEEVAVMGVDNDLVVCGLSDPPISSVSLTLEKAGYEAAHLLDKMMRGEKVDNSVISINPSHVVTRQSTDILAIEDKELAQAVQFIRNNATHAIQVRDVVEASSFSRRNLYDKFRHFLNRSINEEIRRARAERMVELLLQTNYSISQIAMIMNFPNSNHISRYFRKVKGMSPVEFRKKYKLDQNNSSHENLPLNLINSGLQ
jgi:LacI family transcriptional regulator